MTDYGAYKQVLGQDFLRQDLGLYGFSFEH